MKHYLLPSHKPRAPSQHIPPFHAVPVRIRADGWTPLRQAEFIGELAEKRSVAAAARAVSMGRESAYRLRLRTGAEGFAAAWDAALANTASAAGRARLLDALQRARSALLPSRKSTLDDLEWRVETGIWQVILRGGRYCGVRQRADNEALLMLCRRFDAVEARIERAPP